MTRSILLRLLILLAMLCPGCLRQDFQPDISPDVTPAVDVTPQPPPVNDPLRVLVLYDSDEFPKLPSSQLLTLQGSELRDWLEAHHADYRIWDKSVDTTYAPDFWKQAVKLPHDSLPWIWASRGGQGFNGPLQSTADTIARLNSLVN